MLHYKTEESLVRTFQKPDDCLLEMKSDLHCRLAAVNFFLGCVGVTQVTRILMWQKSQEGISAGKVAEQDAKDITNTVGAIAKGPEGAAKGAIK